MTADDSPTPDNKEGFNYGRSTPPPTTSYAAGKKQEIGDAKSAAEPEKEEKDKSKDDKDEIDILRPDVNPGYNPDEKLKDKDENKISKDESDKGKDSKDDKETPCKKLNGSDKLDGQWIPAKDAKSYKDDDDDEEEEENCTVKCLYYTMQCCECTIS